ncbi:MAG: MMPL family transporter [Hymenobacter sp.]
MKESGFGSGLSALTTSIGFFTLMTSTIKPIHNFGLFTGIAVILAFVLSFTLLPAMLVLLNKPALREPRQHGHDWDGVLGRLFVGVLRRRRLIYTLSGLILVASVGLASRVRINSSLLDDLSKSDPVRRDFAFFNDHFAGVRPFELELKPTGGRDIFDPAVLVQTEKIERYLATTYGLKFAASPATLVRTVHQALHGGGLAEYRLPPIRLGWRGCAGRCGSFASGPSFGRWPCPTARPGRLTGRMVDVGSIRADALNGALRHFLRAPALIRPCCAPASRARPISLIRITRT